jgi:uncharacterized iron-regulated membrane protein
MKLKKLLRPIHLLLGLASGIVIFTVAITGCIYAFEEEMRSLIYHDLYTYESKGTPATELNAIIENVQSNYPKQKIRNIFFPAENNKNLIVNLKNKVAVFVNPQTVVIEGDINREKEFLEIILKIHRSLCMGDAGKIITGTSALIFLIMIISGMVLWWPKKTNNSHHKFMVRKSAGKKRFTYDLHSVLGFYASFILIFTVITGLVFSFKWFEGAMYFVAGSKKMEAKVKSSYIKDVKPVSVQVAVAELLTKNAGKDLILVIPEDSVGAYRVTVTEKEGFLKHQNHYFIDQYSAEIIRSNPYDKQSMGEKLRTSNLIIHTGKILGLPGQLLVFFAGLIAASLPVTGFFIWRNKGYRIRPSKRISEKINVN